MFERWTWLDSKEFRKFYNYTDETAYPEWLVNKAIIYGCYRISIESGHAIRDAIGEKKFPGDLTNQQASAVKEAAAWSANHMIKQGLDWLWGTQSVSLGQISTGQTNPDEPDYLLPFIRAELVSVGLMRNINTAQLEMEPESDDFINRDPNDVFLPTWDAIKKEYISKKGQNSLVSIDGTVKIEPSGGLYDGVNLSVDWETAPYTEAKVKLIVDGYLGELLEWRYIKEGDEVHSSSVPDPRVPEVWIAKHVKKYVDSILRIREFLVEDQRPE